MKHTRGSISEADACSQVAKEEASIGMEEACASKGGWQKAPIFALDIAQEETRGRKQRTESTRKKQVGQISRDLRSARASSAVSAGAPGCRVAGAPGCRVTGACGAICRSTAAAAANTKRWHSVARVSLATRCVPRTGVHKSIKGEKEKASKRTDAHTTRHTHTHTHTTPQTWKSERPQRMTALRVSPGGPHQTKG